MFTQHALPVVTGFVSLPGHSIQVIYAIITSVECSHITIDYT